MNCFTVRDEGITRRFKMLIDPPTISATSSRWRFHHRVRAIKVVGAISLALAGFDSPLADTIEITTADIVTKQETLYLNVVADIRLPEQAQVALDKGVDLFFATDVKIARRKQWLPDETSVNLEIVRRISFHALTKKYVVRDLTFDTTSSFANLPSALAALGNHRQIPLINQAIVDRSPDTRILVRIRLIHKELPLPLRLKRFFSQTWKLSSNWYAWPLN